MTTSPDLDALTAALGRSVRRDEPLASYTAMRVGGPADLLIVTESTDELIRAVGLAYQYEIHRLRRSSQPLDTDSCDY